MKKGLFAIAAAALLLPGCATRDRGDVFDLRRHAEGQLELGNRAASRGEHGAALALLDDAMRLAVLADDGGLKARAGLSRAGALMSMGLAEEAKAGWEAALGEALLLGDEALAALARVHAARGRLLALGGEAEARAAAAAASGERARLRDPLSVAFSWSTEALALGELGLFAQAEAAAMRSLALHERAFRHDLAAFDWFMAASFRSRSGDFEGARQALASSIALDRRVENSWGIASSWRALGDVETRAGSPVAARAAYLRAAAIFRAMGHDAAADGALARAGAPPAE